MFSNAGPIFARAIAGYERARATRLADRAWGAMDALESILFSVVALDGFINEATELASWSVAFELEDTPHTVANFATLLTEAHRGRASLELKFQLSRLSLIGEAYDTSALPYQDFALLVELRNALIHDRPLNTFTPNSSAPSGINFNPGEILDRLRAKHITADVEETGHITPWLDRISTIATARWSCRTASAMVYSLLDALPRSALQDRMELLYRAPFSVQK